MSDITRPEASVPRVDTPFVPHGRSAIEEQLGEGHTLEDGKTWEVKVPGGALWISRVNQDEPDERVRYFTQDRSLPSVDLSFVGWETYMDYSTLPTTGKVRKDGVTFISEGSKGKSTFKITPEGQISLETPPQN